MNHARYHSALDGIAAALKLQKIPPWVPRAERSAVEELRASFFDRTDSKRRRFEHALKKLRPVLNASRCNGDLFQHQRALSIPMNETGWRTIFSSLAAGLPRPENQVPQRFQYKYVAVGGETVQQVAQQYGLENPAALAHPAYGYELCMKLRAGDTIFVPWPQPHLEAFIEQHEKLIKVAKNQLEKTINEAELQINDLENTLLLIEVISICANVAAAGAFGFQIKRNIARAASRAKRFAEIGVAAEEFAEHMLEHWKGHWLKWVYETSGHTGLELVGLGLGIAERSAEGFVDRHKDYQDSSLGPQAG